MSDDLDFEYDPREGESSEAFSRRLGLLRRVEPDLAELSERGFQLVVESGRSLVGESGLESDFVIEFGDSRIRLILLPGMERLEEAERLLRRARAYFLEVPDTDALALVLDTPELDTLIVDVYHSGGPGEERPGPIPFHSAMARYFLNNALAIEIPDFRSLVELPSTKELEDLLSRAIADSFGSVAGSRARIPEKLVALEGLAAGDLRQLTTHAIRALRGDDVVPEDAVHRSSSQ